MALARVLAGNIYSYFHDKENNQKLSQADGGSYTPCGSGFPDTDFCRSDFCDHWFCDPFC